MKWCRFHFIYILKYTRYAVILSVIPLLRALLRFDLASLFAALRQDGLIFVGTALFALAQWTASGIRVQNGQLQLRRGAVFRLRVRAGLSSIGGGGGAPPRGGGGGGGPPRARGGAGRTPPRGSGAGARCPGGGGGGGWPAAGGGSGPARSTAGWWAPPS